MLGLENGVSGKFKIPPKCFKHLPSRLPLTKSSMQYKQKVKHHLALNWPVRNLPREPKAQQLNFLGPSMTSELFPHLLLNQHLGPLDTITELPFTPTFSSHSLHYYL